MPNEKDQLWDPFRKLWLARTPEEEVRQAFASYLVRELAYPESLMRTEVGLEVNGMLRRCDILIDKPAGNPVLLVECKAPHVKISQAVFEQASRYNLALKVPFLVLTNGTRHVCCQVDFTNRKVTLMSQIPSFESL